MTDAATPTAPLLVQVFRCVNLRDFKTHVHASFVNPGDDKSEIHMQFALGAALPSIGGSYILSLTAAPPAA